MSKPNKKLQRVMLSGFLLCLVMGSGVAAETSHKLHIEAQDGRLHITENDAPVLRYKAQEVPNKPYLLEWHAPNGENVLRDAPADHPHHHGLMFAITVDDINFWEEFETGGLQEHLRFDETQAVTGTETPYAAFRESLEWRAPESRELFLLEERHITHHAAPEANYRLLTWSSTLQTSPDRDAVTLSGTAYHGLGMRFAEWMDEGGDFVLAEDITGELVDGIHYLAQASWSAYTVANESGERTVAMFDAPANPRPALWFMMVEPFGYLSATIDLWRDAMTLEAGSPLTLTYGVAVWDSVVEPAEIEARYNAWKETIDTLEIGK